MGPARCARNVGEGARRITRSRPFLGTQSTYGVSLLTCDANTRRTSSYALAKRVGWRKNARRDGDVDVHRSEFSALPPTHFRAGSGRGGWEGAMQGGVSGGGTCVRLLRARVTPLKL